MNRRMDGWMNEWMDKWMGRWVDGWVDGCHPHEQRSEQLVSKKASIRRGLTG